MLLIQMMNCESYTVIEVLDFTDESSLIRILKNSLIVELTVNVLNLLLYFKDFIQVSRGFNRTN